MINIAEMPKYDAYKDSGAGWVGCIPESWSLTRLGSHFVERRTKVSDTDYQPLSVTKNGILPQLDNAAKTKDGDNRKLVKAGDFVINSRSDRKGSSGVSSLNGSVSLINIVLEPKGIHSGFCHHLLKSYAFIEEYYRVGRGIVADLWTTRYDEMRTISIAVPTLEEQSLIANFLDQKTAQIDEAIAIKEQQINLLKERKQIIIQQAVTQGLDPNVPMKDSGVEWIGKIPEHWDLKPLTKEVFVQEGPGIMAVDFHEDGVPLIRISGVKSETVTLDGCNYLNPLKVCKKWSHFKLKKGDLVISGSASTELVSEVECEAEGAILYTGLIRVTPRGTNVMKEYLKIFFGTQLFFTQIDLQKTGSTISHYGPSHLSRMFILLPDLAEQKRIVSYVNVRKQEIIEAMRLLERQVKKLKEYKATLINSAVTGKIRITPEMVAG